MGRAHYVLTLWVRQNGVEALILLIRKDCETLLSSCVRLPLL